MELLEPDDMKNALLRKSAEHRQQMEGDVKLLTEETEKILINALVIGGSLALTYLLIRQLSGSKKRAKKKVKARKIKLVKAAEPEEEEVEVQSGSAFPSGILTQVGTALASQASVFLLNLAKEKLTEYLQSLSEKKAQDERA